MTTTPSVFATRVSAQARVHSELWVRARLRASTGPVVLLLSWELLALSGVLGRYALPTPTAVLSTEWHDGFYLTDAWTTLWEAGRGFLIGNLAAFVLALTCASWIRLRPPRRSQSIATARRRRAEPTSFPGRSP